MDERLAAVIGAREGVVSASDAARVGISPVQLDGLTRSGELVRLRRGAYALRRRYQEANLQERYRLRTRAILRTRPPVDAASHRAPAASRAARPPVRGSTPPGLTQPTPSTAIG